MSTETNAPHAPRLADHVHQILLDAIVTGELAPGQQLRDRDWSARLGISRTPVRDALQYMQWQGLTEVQAARFTKLLSFTSTSARDEAAGWAIIHASHADLFCARSSDELLERLRRAHARHRDAGSRPARTTANLEFFRILRDAADHFGLRLSGTAMSYRLTLAAAELPDPGIADSSLHIDVIDALSAGDPKAFRRALDRWTRHMTQHGDGTTGTAA